MTDTREWPLTPAPPLKRWTLLALVGIVLLGAGLRLYKLADQSLWYDECASLYLARYVDLEGSLFDSTKTTEPPMMAILSKIWYETIIRGLTHYEVTDPRNDFLIRLLPCLLNLFSIPLIFALARKLLADNVAALFAALLFAVSPFMVFYGQEYRIYAWVILVQLCGVWCMLQALEKNKVRHWIGFGAALAILLYSHFFSVWAVFTCSVFYLTTLPWRFNRLVPWTLTNAVMMVVALPALLCAYKMNQLVQEITPSWYPPANLHVGLITFKDFFAGYTPSAKAYKLIFVLAAGLFTLGLGGLLWRRRWPAATFLLLFSILPIAGSIVVWSGDGFSFYEHRLFIFSGVTAIILVGEGLRTLARMLGARRIAGWNVGKLAAAGALGLMLLLMAHSLRNHYRHAIHGATLQRQGVFDKVDFREATKYIEANAKPGDLLTYPTIFNRYPFEHYSKMEQYKVGGYKTDEYMYIRALSNEPMLRRHGMLPTPIGELMTKTKRIWLVRAYGITFEDGPFSYYAENILKETWHVTDEKWINGLYIRLFEPNATASAPAPTPAPAPAAAASPVTAPARQNVLLVVVDTLRADRLTGARNGQPIMPKLRAFAEQSRHFTHAWAAATWTKPSVTSILTGLYPSTHHVEFGVQRAWFPGQDLSHVQVLPPQQMSLATFLKNQGFKTVAVQTNWHIAQSSGYDQGFDQFELHFGQAAGFVTDRALKLLGDTKDPWFLYAHYLDPHSPYTPPASTRDAFGPYPQVSPDELMKMTDEVYRNDYYMDRFKFDVGFSTTREIPDYSPTAKAMFQQLYDAECHYTDAEVMRLVETVRAQWPQTTVIVTADHGEEFEEHGGYGHAKTVYEELAHVPLLVNIPGDAPSEVASPVETIDIAPTIAQAAGVAPRAEWQGTSLLAPAPDRITYCETQGSIPEFKTHAQAVYQAPFKLVNDVQRQRVQLFDLANDPGEQHDLAAQKPEQVQALLALWEEHARAAAANPAAAIAPGLVDLDPAAKEQLQGIGYLPGDTTKKKP